MPQGKEIDVAYFMTEELMPGSKRKICVWCGCSLSSLRALFKKKKSIVFAFVFSQYCYH